MFTAAALEPRWQGPVNFVAPGAVTNAAFTTTLARVLGRPAFLPVPRWVLRAGFGAMADEALLASSRVVPEVLVSGGFAFAHPELEPALRAELRR
jgi:NAD dependent epimerase/dehydratase family enzyme